MTTTPASRRWATVALAAVVGAALAACGPTVPTTTCPMFPADSHWHADVRGLPVRADSDAVVARVGATASLKADFGSGLWEGGPIGIPYVVVDGTQPEVPISFQYASESDAGPYPIPPDAPIEGGPSSNGDRHVIVVDRDACRLYEVYAARRNADGSWHAGSGATWDLRSHALRPAGWTSADAAGLPILPGLVRYDEVAAGKVEHAIRMTVPVSRTSYVWPARHQAGSTGASAAPPMGQRFRLKDSVDESTFPAQVRPIIRALKVHGTINADNGSPWYITGVPDERWDNDALQTLRRIKGSDFEAIDATPLQVSAHSGQARPPA